MIVLFLILCMCIGILLEDQNYDFVIVFKCHAFLSTGGP